MPNSTETETDIFCTVVPLMHGLQGAAPNRTATETDVFCTVVPLMHGLQGAAPNEEHH